MLSAKILHTVCSTSINPTVIGILCNFSTAERNLELVGQSSLKRNFPAKSITKRAIFNKFLEQKGHFLIIFEKLWRTVLFALPPLNLQQP